MASDLKAKLKKSDPVVRKFVAELEKRNAKLQTQIVKLEADAVERNNRIKALEKAPKMSAPTINIHLVAPQTAAKVKEWEDRLGIPESERVSHTLAADRNA